MIEDDPRFHYDSHTDATVVPPVLELTPWGREITSGLFQKLRMDVAPDYIYMKHLLVIYSTSRWMVRTLQLVALLCSYVQGPSRGEDSAWRSRVPCL